MLEALITQIFRFGPLLFGLGFLAPLFCELIELSGAALPFGMAPIAAGLILGGGLGLMAQLRGSWIWRT